MGRMELRHELVHCLRPIRPQLTRKQLLDMRQVGHIHKTIISLFESDSFPRQLSGQPLATVKTDMNREGNPGLQSQMHQSQFAVEHVEVQVRALAGVRP